MLCTMPSVCSFPASKPFLLFYTKFPYLLYHPLKHNLGAGELAVVKNTAALQEDTDSIPSTRMPAHYCLHLQFWGI